jgi:hypothetical protein
MSGFWVGNSDFIFLHGLSLLSLVFSALEPRLKCTHLTKTGLCCKLIYISKPKCVYKPVQKEQPMKTHTDQTRLETLHQQAKQFTLLETTRRQDQSNLRQALSILLEIAKHWTIGIRQMQPVAKLGGAK